MRSEFLIEWQRQKAARIERRRHEVNAMLQKALHSKMTIRLQPVMLDPCIRHISISQDMQLQQRMHLWKSGYER